MDADADPDPPSYLQASLQASPLEPIHLDDSHPWSRLGLPSGMFLVQNRAQGKTLDLLAHRSHDRAPLGAHPVKRPSLRGLSLQHAANNQLFFLDWNGHLNAAAASRPLDVIDDHLVLAHPRPVATYPSPLSHPLPRFLLDPATSTLQVVFSHDPSYPPPLGPTAAASDPAYDEYDYLVETVPLKRSVRPTSVAAKKAGQVIEGFLGRVGTLNPFSAAPDPTAPPVPVPVPVPVPARSGSVSSTVYAADSKRLPRDRDASLPPPPIPLKDPPLPPPPSPPLALPAFPFEFESSRPMRESSFAISPTTRSPAVAQTASPSPLGSADDELLAGRRRSSTSTVTPDAAVDGGRRRSSAATATARASSPRDRRSSHDSDAEREEEDDDDESGESESDDEPSAFRPVRIVRLLRASNWREREFPFDRHQGRRGSPGGKHEDDDGDRLTDRNKVSPIGLGFEDDSQRRRRRARGVPERTDADALGELDADETTGVESVWPEAFGLGLGHGRETSFASTSTCVPLDDADPVRPPPSVESAAEARRRRAAEGKERRKWRRRQWDVVPVRVEPNPARSTGASWRVRHELDGDMYGFQGEVSDGEHVDYELEGEEDEDEGEGEGEEEEPARGRARVGIVGTTKRGSIETARSVVSGVGTFLTSRLLWSASTSSTPHAPAADAHFDPRGRREEDDEGDEADLPALPTHAEEADHEDAREVRSDELERLGTRNRRKSSLAATKASLVASPPLPDLPAVPTTPLATVDAVEVPLPDSLPATPVIDGSRESQLAAREPTPEPALA
ncbi:hypothetical protein JCM11491_002267 [Sporobolomyces phaffii]